MLVFLTICLLFGSTYAAGVYGADVSSAVSEAECRCLKSQGGVEFFTARAYTSTGHFDTACVASVANAHKAGIPSVGVYFFPAYHHKAANASVDEFHSAMSSHGVRADRVWLDIEGTQYWSGNHGSNVRYMTDLHDRLRYHGYAVGMYTSASQWVPITGNSRALGFLPVWYAAYQSPPQPNFNDWHPFGGWSRPTIKQFRGTHSLCGASIDGNWHP